MKINIEKITKLYGNFKALDGFSAELTEGVYGLLGPNGAGKSTLINIIVGLIKKNGGTIRFDGRDIVDTGEKYLDRIGYLPQYPKFYGNFTVYEFMQYMSALKNISRSRINKRIDELLEFLNLSEQRDKKTSRLSGGMRQRLGIAQALINDPEFLILDEPTAGLDPKERIRFRNLVSQLGKNRTVLLATHIVSDVEFTAKEIILMKGGKKILQSVPTDLTVSMNGKIWKAEVDSDRLDTLLHAYSVSSVRNTDNGYEIRIVSDNIPEDIEAVPAVPDLEDVYLHYFGEG